MISLSYSVKPIPMAMYALLNAQPMFLLRDMAEKKAALVGGAIRDALSGKTPKDYDWFYFTDNSFRAAKDQLLAKEGFRVVKENERHSRFEKNGTVIDVTKTVYKSLIQLLEECDFTISKVAYYGNAMVVGNHFEKDLEDRKLIFTGSENPEASLMRAFRFEKGGFYLPSATIQKIKKAIVTTQPITIDLAKLGL